MRIGHFVDRNVVSLSRILVSSKIGKSLYLKMELLLLSFIVVLDFPMSSSGEDKLLLVSLASEETDEHNRFMRSARVNNISVDVFHLEETMQNRMTNIPWDDKLKLLRDGLQKYKEEEELVIMFIQSDKVVVVANQSQIINKFKTFNSKIVMSTKSFINRDQLYGSSDEETGYRYLCSGGVIGYAQEIYELLSLRIENSNDEDNEDVDEDMPQRDEMFDDDLYYTYQFLDDREKFNIKLDHHSNIFQNLDGAKDHVNVTFDGYGEAQIINTRFKTMPAVIYGNSQSKIFLNYLANYVPKGSTQEGCLSCNEDLIDLASIGSENWPSVLLGIHILTLTPFIEAFMQNVKDLDYPKEKIDVFIHNREQYHNHTVQEWIRKGEGIYNSITHEGHTSSLDTQHGKNLALSIWRSLKTDFYFSIDSSVTLLNRKTLQLLIQQNRTVLAPMMTKHERIWSNFWGDVTSNGYYARSEDYLEIVNNERRGIWNCPCVFNVYLISFSVIDTIPYDPFLSTNTDDADIKFCSNIRDRNLFIYLSNLHDYGHLKEMNSYTVTADRKNMDLYQLFDNRLDWEDKYIHPYYHKYLSGDSTIPEPCTFVYWVPAVTEEFTRELIEECEHYGRWSGGKNNHADDRMGGSYEDVPTVDIHMDQIGFEKHWLQMLKDYFTPIAEKIFTGYFTRNVAQMNFVVKYSTQPGGQIKLKAHHDSSTYTINLALNSAGVDYEGGGVRFVRDNCSVTDTKVGWALIHPGRLTHLHEGLPLKSGTRYVMVSFVDPPFLDHFNNG